MKRLIIAICVFTCYMLVHAAVAETKEFSDNQIACVKMAYKAGSRIKWGGDTFGETVAGILWQESKGNFKKYQKNGVVVGDMDRHGRPKSLGPMQVQLATARDLEKWYPILFKLKFGPYSPTDEELIIALLTDIEFNINCGARYFEYLLNRMGDYNAAILAYNRGPSGVGDPNNYVAKVHKWRREIVRPIIN